MSLVKNIAFFRPLKSVEVEYAGEKPMEANEQKKAIEEAYQRGLQEASDKFNAQLLEMRQQMQDHADGILSNIQGAYDKMATTVANALPEVVVGSVYKLIGPDAIKADALKSKVEHLISQSCPAQEPVEVYMSQQEYDELSKIYDGFTTSHPRLTFKVDVQLNKGDCRMVSKFGEVDATLKTQLMRLMDELQSA